jgi:hypothetical protein
MDSFEKKLHALYQQQKKEDEKSLPGFDAFNNGFGQPKPVRHSYFFLKVAASVVVVVASAVLYFNNHWQGGKDASEIYPSNINRHLPTQSLLDKSTGGEYIWDWKAPSDQLLDDATKSINTKR